MEGEMRLEYIGIGELRKFPRNPKDHDIGALHESMKRWGFTAPMLVDEKSGQLAAGHGRLETLVQMMRGGKKPPERVVEKDGEWFVPVIRGVGFENEDELMAYVVADNRMTEVGGWLDEQLVEVLQDLAGKGEEMLRGVGYDMEDVDAMLRSMAENEVGGTAPAKSKIDEMRALQKKWGTQEGQVWLMGGQRLAVGDCRKAETVAAVFGVENLKDVPPVEMLLTDPPYNIGFDRQSRVRKVVAMPNDEMDWDEYQKFTRDWLALAGGTLADPCAVFICIGFRAYPYLAIEARKLWKEQNCIVWAKPNIGLGGRSGNYRYKHELIWTGGELPVAAPEISDVWDFGRDDQELTHVSPKPYDLIAQALSQIAPQSVYDPFVGSGTTLLAAEAQGVTGYGIDIDPGATAVTLERFAETYQKVPVLEEK